jgi:hypothetical protein
VTAVLAPVAAMFGLGLAFTAFNMTGGIWTWAGLAGPWPLLG